MTHTLSLPADIQALLDRVPTLLPLRRGGVSERYMKCGKPTCACRTDDAARHGPYFSWTRVIGGVTHSRLLRPDQAEVVRRQVAAGAEFRKLIEHLWEAAERLADQELAPPTDASTETAEKGGSKMSSVRRSRRKSPP